jgi:hypothetical protein
MTDQDRYSRAAVHCAEMALKASATEIREFWLTAERGYRFLLDRANRIETEKASRVMQ